MHISPAAIALAGAVMLLSPGPAYAQSCEQLWYERNSIYKGAGYCFKTPRAISAFGNAGCVYASEAAVPLSPDQRAQIAEIAHMEQSYGCR